jgi:hypothetical protein
MLFTTFWSRSKRLALLSEIHPEALRASRVDVGLRTVPVAAIKGTTSPTQTRRDRAFMPWRVARGRDWEGRWQRLQDAARTLAILPPIDLLQVGEGFWVVDGHNRVAMARAVGQLAVDANVARVRWQGGPEPTAERGLLTPLIEEGAGLRATLRGRGVVPDWR